MGSFFNLDNPFFTFMGKVFDIFVVSILWMVCCIPIITIGPANSALYYAVVKVIRKERGYLTKEFFKSFKQNFKVGAITGVLMLVFTVILYINIQFSRQMNSTFGNVLMCIYISLSLFLLFLNVYIFPVLSRFTMNVIQLFKTTFFISIRHLPTTIVLSVLFAAVAFVSIILPIVLFFIPGAYCAVSSFLIERVLKKYIPQAETGEDEPKVDEWYLN